jgi:thiosulfate/3-mercaptopyruvate sulfurtransferase
MFKVFGHERVSVINGGLSAWQAAGGPVESAEPALLPPSSHGDYSPSFNPQMVSDWREVLDVVTAGSAQIVDARSEARFRCEAPEPRPGLPGGNIPGSLNLPFTEVVYPDDMSRFRPLGEITAAFDRAGVVPGARVIFTCGSGVTAAVVLFAMNLIRNNATNTAIYDGTTALCCIISKALSNRSVFVSVFVLLC